MRQRKALGAQGVPSLAEPLFARPRPQDRARPARRRVAGMTQASQGAACAEGHPSPPARAPQGPRTRTRAIEKRAGVLFLVPRRAPHAPPPPPALAWISVSSSWRCSCLRRVYKSPPAASSAGDAPWDGPVEAPPQPASTSMPSPLGGRGRSTSMVCGERGRVSGPGAGAWVCARVPGSVVFGGESAAQTNECVSAHAPSHPRSPPLHTRGPVRSCSLPMATLAPPAPPVVTPDAPAPAPPPPTFVDEPDKPCVL